MHIINRGSILSFRNSKPHCFFIRYGSSMAYKSISQSYDFLNSPACQFWLFSTHENLHVLFLQVNPIEILPWGFPCFPVRMAGLRFFLFKISYTLPFSTPPRPCVWLGEPLRLLRTRAMEELPRNAVLPSEVRVVVGWNEWMWALQSILVVEMYPV